MPLGREHDNVLLGDLLERSGDRAGAELLHHVGEGIRAAGVAEHDLVPEGQQVLCDCSGDFPGAHKADLHDFAPNSVSNFIGCRRACTVQAEKRVDQASCRVPTPTVAAKKASKCFSSGNGSGMVRPF